MVPGENHQFYSTGSRENYLSCCLVRGILCLSSRVVVTCCGVVGCFALGRTLGRGGELPRPF